jgi:hypothetical protein
MTAKKIFAALLATLFLLLRPSFSQSQDQKPANVAAQPPEIALLVHQSFFSGKTSDRRKFTSTLSRACDHLDAPKYWMDMESLAGDPEALVFSSFDSYEQMEQTNADWNKFLAGHPDLGRTQEEIDGLIGNQRRIIAIRRDDLGYMPDSIDLSEARFVRVLEVHVLPGHESDFAEAFKILADAYNKIQSDTPWVVYQVDAGAPAPTFLVLRPMVELKQNDDMLASVGSLVEAEGDQGVETLKKIARESYISTESNLYAINPELSHVSKAFADADPDYWLHQAPEPSSAPKANPKSGVSNSK